MDALTRVPLSQQAANALLEAIGGGRWEVGGQLPGELALAGELQVSRSTLREALRDLAARGVVTSRQGIGVFVTATSPVDGWERLAQIGAITDLVQVRVAIEARAAALAAHARRDADIERIRRALDERNRLVGASAAAELAAADIRLHREIVCAARNPPLTALFDSLQARLVAAMTELLDLMPAASHDTGGHAAVVEAIEASDADRAETLTREHLLGLAVDLESLTCTGRA